MRLRLPAAALVAMAVLLTEGEPASIRLGVRLSAQSTSVNGKIAYSICGLPSTIAFVSSQCDIGVMEADGSNPTNITNTTDVNEFSPAWSPDGTSLAYFEGTNAWFNLHVMNADGSNPSATITTTFSPTWGTLPTWSPAGTQIAFVRTNPGFPVTEQADIVVIDLVTRAETTITGPAPFGTALLDADEVEPTWSPSDGKIAFAGVRYEDYPDSITGATIQGAQWEIITANPDGSDQQIVSVGDRNTDRANFLEEDRAPAWSPDGTKLVFMSQAQVPSCCGPWQIWAVNRDGSGATNLTNDATVNDLWPRWSPDGTQIVFSRYDSTGGFDLYTMPAPTTLPLAAPVGPAVAAATGAATRLTTNGNVSDPDWGRVPGSVTHSTYTLFVSLVTQTKNAGGTVTSTPAGIRCGRDCRESYAAGTMVELGASPKKGTTFAGWSGACTGTGLICRVSMDDVRGVKATFTR